MRIKGLDSNLIEIQLVLIALGLELGRSLFISVYLLKIHLNAIHT